MEYQALAAIVAAILATLAAVTTAVLQTRSQRMAAILQTEQVHRQQTLDAYSRLVDTLQKEVTRLNTEVGELRNQVDKLASVNIAMEAELAWLRSNGTPLPPKGPAI